MQLAIDGPVAQRRWTIAVRLPILVVHVIAGFILSFILRFVAVCGWFGALWRGRAPLWVAGYAEGYLRWAARYWASLLLLTDHYPALPFEEDGNAVTRIELRVESVDRVHVLLRGFAAVPAAIVAAALVVGWSVLAVPLWLVVLALGRMPAWLFDVAATSIRYGVRYGAYICLLTDAYPLPRVFGDVPVTGTRAPEGPAGRIRTRPLFLSRGQRAALVGIIVAGPIGNAGLLFADAALSLKADDLKAATGTYRARNDFVASVNTAIRGLKKCEGAACARTEMHTIERGAARTLSRLHRIRYPERVGARVHRAETALGAVRREAHTIRTARGARFVRALRHTKPDTRIERVVKMLTRLGDALR